jgi:iron(III) transport system permease protein
VTAAAAPRPAAARRLELGTVLLTLLVLVVGALVLLPVGAVVLQSFQVSQPGHPVQWGLAGWHGVFHDTSLRTAAWNTLTLTVARQVLSGALAIFVAWLLARTDVPGGKTFEFVFWLAFFLPALTVTLSWILLLDPQFGLVNQVLKPLGLGPLSIYTFWGIVWIHVLGTSTAFKVMVLTPAFRNMNSALEEASRMAGASTWRMVLDVFLPLMLPAIVAVELLGVLNSLQAFEVEQIVGTRFGFYVFSTWIYNGFSDPTPRFDIICAFAVVVMIVAMGGIILQRRYFAGRQYATVSGQFQTRRLALGALRWPAAALVGALVLLIVGVPLGLSVMGTFMKLFGFFTAQPWTLDHWRTAFHDRILVRSIWNTVQLGLGTAIAGVLLQSLVAYVVVKTRYAGRGVLDFLSWLPFTVPGIILSLGLLTMLLQPAFRWMYGTMGSLVLALVIANMPLGVQIVKGNLLQLSTELEEASRICGAGWFATYRHIVLPLLSPTLVVVAVISFIGAARNISQVALLSNTAIRPLSLMQLDYLADGKYEVAAVIATLLLFVSLGLALVARVFGYRGVS